MAPTLPKVRSQAEWAEILDRIQADVEQLLEQTPELPILAPPDRLNALHEPLDKLASRMSELQTALERAERNAANTDAALHEEAESFQLWRESMKQAQVHLATWTNPANG